jgi:hypothetical protein
LKGDAARIIFAKNFKEVQRIKTQLDQYTDLTCIIHTTPLYPVFSTIRVEFCIERVNTLPGIHPALSDGVKIKVFLSRISPLPVQNRMQSSGTGAVFLSTVKQPMCNTRQKQQKETLYALSGSAPKPEPAEGKRQFVSIWVPPEHKNKSYINAGRLLQRRKVSVHRRWIQRRRRIDMPIPLS